VLVEGLGVRAGSRGQQSMSAPPVGSRSSSDWAPERVPIAIVLDGVKKKSVRTSVSSFTGFG
jgi:hypothetical protein